MKVKCSYEDYDGDPCKHRGSDGYCVLEEIEMGVGMEGSACCQEEDVGLPEVMCKLLPLTVLLELGRREDRSSCDRLVYLRQARELMKDDSLLEVGIFDLDREIEELT